MTKTSEPSFLASENPNPVIRADLDGKILYANPAAEPILHFWDKKISDNLPPLCLTRLKSAINTSQIEELKEQIIRAEKKEETLFCTPGGIDWLKMNPSDRALYFYRHPLNSLPCEDLPQELCNERVIHEAEKSIYLSRI